MNRDMDHLCTTILIVISVLMFCMGYVELSRFHKKSLSDSPGMCGMKSKIDKKGIENKTSAKQAGLMQNKPADNKGDTYMFINEAWPMNESEDCKHKQATDNVDTEETFGKWIADEETTKKHVASAPDKQKAFESANQRAAWIDLEARTPTNTKNIGLPGLRESAGLSQTNSVKFSDNCVHFLQSDSYIEARKTNNKLC